MNIGATHLRKGLLSTILGWLNLTRSAITQLYNNVVLKIIRNQQIRENETHMIIKASLNIL